MDMAARVQAAMAAHPRTGFLPARQRGQAAADAPLPIGAGQTNSQPRTVAAMLDLLDVRPGMRVLDVGAGSGWTTALLAWLTGPHGAVIGVERLPRLATFGAANLDAAGVPWARLLLATPGVLGAPHEAPFDRILVSAQASGMPYALLDQLADGGILVVPVEGWMHRAVRVGPGEDDVDVSTHGAYRFVPLIED